MERIKKVEEIKLLPAFVLMEIIDKRKTASGIILPENSENVIRHGIIISKGREVPEEYQIGDIVLDYNVQGVRMYRREDKNGEEQKYVICPAYSLLVVITPDNFDDSIQPKLRSEMDKKGPNKSNIIKP